MVSYILVLNYRTTFGILANGGRGMMNELISLRGNFTVMKPAKNENSIAIYIGQEPPQNDSMSPSGFFSPR